MRVITKYLLSTMVYTSDLYSLKPQVKKGSDTCIKKLIFQLIYCFNWCEKCNYLKKYIRCGSGSVLMGHRRKQPVLFTEVSVQVSSVMFNFDGCRWEQPVRCRRYDQCILLSTSCEHLPRILSQCCVGDAASCEAMTLAVRHDGGSTGRFLLQMEVWCS